MKQVRLTPWFFDDLDEQLPAERTDELPSRRDFEICDLLGIVERVAAAWDDLPPFIPGRTDYRQWIGAGASVFAVAVDGQLAPDGAVELVAITIEAHPPWPADEDADQD